MDEGVVIAHLGRSLLVETSEGRMVACHSRKRIVDVAVGDRVAFDSIDDEHGVVTEVLPRSTVLLRPARGRTTRAVAANISRLWVVLAIQPEADFLLVDQILAVCEHRGIAAGILQNKADIPGDRDDLAHELAAYRASGYPVLDVSARSGIGIAELREQLRFQCSMFSGQSGVGKSSLTNALLPDRSLRTGELSQKSGLGRHTTTTATLYRLPDGGALIDSPGVAVFGLAQMTASDIAWGYPEFRPWITNCRFRDCLHLEDAGCAVHTALEAGQISTSRHSRYRRLIEKCTKDSFAATARPPD